MTIERKVLLATFAGVVIFEAASSYFRGSVPVTVQEHKPASQVQADSLRRTPFQVRCTVGEEVNPEYTRERFIDDLQLRVGADRVTREQFRAAFLRYAINADVFDSAGRLVPGAAYRVPLLSPDSAAIACVTPVAGPPWQYEPRIAE